MRIIGSLLLIALSAVVTAAQTPSVTPQVASSSPEVLANPNTAPSTQPAVVALDVKKLATISRPAVALIMVLEKDGKIVKSGSGFFVSADGKLGDDSQSGQFSQG